MYGQCVALASWKERKTDTDACKYKKRSKTDPKKKWTLVKHLTKGRCTLEALFKPLSSLRVYLMGCQRMCFQKALGNAHP